MQLRNYQLNAMERIRQAYRNGFNSPILVAVCGFGKSVVAAEIAKLSTQKNNHVLVIAHRIELIEQLTSTFIAWGVDINSCDILMVQSVTRRISQIKPPTFIICDESHHSNCNTYTKIFNAFPAAKRLLLTATPARTNGEGLRDVADIIIETESVKWLIDNKYLAPFEYYAPKILVDTAQLRTVKGDYEQSDVITQIDRPQVYGDVIAKYNQYAAGKKAIAFCSSIQHSKTTAAAFNEVGIRAEHLDGTTDKNERRRIMQEFRSGEVRIICNYEIISEGVSVDDCECCILLRPTQSLILQTQSSMRCMRYQPNKTAVILDMVGNFERHGLPDTPHKWSLDGQKKHTRTETEPEIKARMCGQCFKVYSGVNPVCPFCNHNNGKTRAQIKQDEQAELERITAIQKRETNKAVTLEQLIEIGKQRKYKNPVFWAQMKYKNSWRNKK